MKKLVCVALLVVLSGCVTVKIPKYLPSENAYKKKFFLPFDDVLVAAKQALIDTGWQINDMASPSIFEQEASTQTQGKQILIFTETRQTPLILLSRYKSINVYLRSVDDGTEVEIRYMGMTQILFINSKNYKNDDVVNKVYDHMAQLLES